MSQKYSIPVTYIEIVIKLDRLWSVRAKLMGSVLDFFKSDINVDDFCFMPAVP